MNTSLAIARRAPGRRTRNAGFTMTELALCIAIVAVAMVAIIGVMPSGLTVQKQNKEDTQVLEDGKFYLDCIRTGSARMHDLTNYVDFIRLERFKEGNRSGKPDIQVDYRCYWFHDDLGYLKSPYTLVSSEEILGLLSLPQLTVIKNTVYTNVITAQMRPLGSSFLQQPYHIGGAAPRPNQLEGAFHYLATIQNVSVPVPPAPIPPNATPEERLRAQIYTQERLSRLHEVRFTAQWPVFPIRRDNEWVLRTGNNRRTFRIQFNGTPDPKGVFKNVAGSGVDVQTYVTGSF